MESGRFHNCVRVLVALQCLELVWSYSILMDTLRNDQQIENSINSLAQLSQHRSRRQVQQDPQTNQGQDVAPPDGGGNQGDAGTGIQDPGASLDPQLDGSLTSDPGHSEHGQDVGSHSDSGGSDSGSSDAGNSESGNSDSGGSDSGGSDSGGSESGNSDSGGSESGNSDSGGSESGSSESGNSDSGGSESGSSDGGNSEIVPSEGTPVDSGQSDSGSSEIVQSEGIPVDGGQSKSGYVEGSMASDQPIKPISVSHQEPINSNPSGLRDNWKKPMALTREGERPPRALSMTAAETAEAPVAMAMTGGQGETGGHVHTVPLEAHSGQPMALPQKQANPEGQATTHRPAPNWNTQGASQTGGGGGMSPWGVPMGGGMAPGGMNQMAQMNMMGGDFAERQRKMYQNYMQNQAYQRLLQGSSGSTTQPGSQVNTVPLNGQPVALAQRQAPPRGQGNTPRPPPNWNKQNQGAGTGTTGGGGGTAQGSMPPWAMPMPGGMPPGGMPNMNQMTQMNMMGGDFAERQRNMYRNYMQAQAYQRFMNGSNFPGNHTYQNGMYGNYGNYPAYNYGGDNEGYGYGVEIGQGYPFPPCTNMSDPVCQQRMMMQREIQIETPYGELDMEPGEIDIEGPAAYHLLRQIGLSSPNANPHLKEVTLNIHVLKALKQRFGVNTTAGIRRMSSDPEFQAFMYQVLTHTAPVAPGEYTANLSAAEVNAILKNLSTSTSNSRVPTGNLDQAKLDKNASNTVLTIGGPNQNMGNNPWSQMMPGMMPGMSQMMPGMSQMFPGMQGAFPGMQGAFPGFASPQVQDPSQATAQAGRTQALVQGPGEGSTGGKKKEAEEKKGTKHSEGKPTEGTKHSLDTGNTTSVNPGSLGSKPIVSSVGINQGTSNPVNSQPGQSPILTQPGDIIGKDGQFGISKDQQTRNQQLLNQAGTPSNVAPGTNPNMAPGTNPYTGHGSHSNTGHGNNPNIVHGTHSNTGPGMVPNQGVGADPASKTAVAMNVPIGIQEAGLDIASVRNATIQPPIQAPATTYASSTAFAIVAVSLIVFAIIVGPLLCYLCKLKEKRNEKLRKEQAMKNRSLSENNIAESMVLHDFGDNSQKSATNRGASSFGERYTALDSDIAEIERFKRTEYLP